jgi:hypothetical protein
MRQVNIQTLSKALQELRDQTLRAFECYVTADKLTLPYQSGLNPPVWELGHVAWFQEYWIARNSQRSSGLAYDRTQPLKASRLDDADIWFDSAKISHATRWDLALLNHQQCITYAQQTLAQTLELLHQETDHSPALYFYWLVLQHEAMHLEASAYMAQSLRLPFKASWQQEAANGDMVASSTHRFQHKQVESRTAHVPSQTWQLGSGVAGFYLNNNASDAIAYTPSDQRPFCFDNELIEKNCVIQAFEISLQPVKWAQYLKFVAATGYHLPKYIRKTDIDFEAEIFGRWAPLNWKHQPSTCRGRMPKPTALGPNAAYPLKRNGIALQKPYPVLSGVTSGNGRKIRLHPMRALPRILTPNIHNLGLARTKC